VTPFDALIPKSLLALYIKLPGGECLAHVDTEGFGNRRQLGKPL
jgi:hypothetical protein